MVRSRYLSAEKRVHLPSPGFKPVRTMNDAVQQQQQRQRRNGGSVACKEKKTGMLCEERRVPWDIVWLKTAECALSSHFRQDKTPLTIPDFLEFSQKLELRIGAKGNEVRMDDGVALLNEEKLFVDLLSCTSPVLYSLVDDRIQIVDYEGNRMKKLIELASNDNKRDFRAARDKFVARIAAHKRLQTNSRNVEEENHRVKAKSTADAVLAQTGDPDIRPGMTLEERVTARQAAQKVLSESIAIHQKLGKPDAQALIRLADALYSHARHSLLSDGHLFSHNPPRRRKNYLEPTQRPFAMTLKNIMSNFTTCLVPIRRPSIPRERATRKQMLNAIRTMRDLAPEWISWKGELLSKNTTIWIHPVEDFGLIRQRLGAPPCGSSSKNKHLSRGESQSTERLDLPAKRASDLPLPRSPKKPRVSLSSDEEYVPPTYIGTRRAGRKEVYYNDDSHDDVDRDLSWEDWDGLRINRNLIIADADHDGGCIIQPSPDSPRGLRQLFELMIAGKRI